MAEIEVTIPTVPYGNIKVRGANAHEVLGVLNDPVLGEVRAFASVADNSTVSKGTGAILSDEMTYQEKEALATLKEALGATESPVEASQLEPAPQTKAARADFLKKFGGSNG